MSRAMSEGELRLHLYGIQSATLKSARLAEVQNDILSATLDQAREQTWLLEQQAAESRVQTELLREQRDTANAQLKLSLATAAREEEYRRLMWMETTDTGRRYAAIAEEAKELAEWVDEGLADIRRRVWDEADEAGLWPADRDFPEVVDARLAAPEPALVTEPITRPAITGAVKWGVGAGIVSLVAFMWWFNANYAAIEAGEMRFLEALDSAVSFLPDFLIMAIGLSPVIVGTLVGAAAGAWWATREVRKENQAAREKHAKLLEKFHSELEDARRQKALRDRRVERFGYDPEVEDAGEHSNWLTAMRGEVSNPVEVSDILWGIVNADHHTVTAKMMDAWEAFIASIEINPTDGSPRRMLVEAP